MSVKPSNRLRQCAVLVILCLLASAAQAYTIWLKDGSKLDANAKYRVEGDRAFVTLLNGTTTTLPLSAIDVERTEEYNTRDYGQALVVEGNKTRPLTMKEAPPMTLNEALERQKQRERARKEEPKETQIIKTAAGYNDLTRLQRRPFRESELAARVAQELRVAGLRDFEIHQGTTEDRIFLQLQTNNEKEVFQALRVSANTYELVKKMDGSVEALEVLMMTATKNRAGQFLLNHENTPLLVNQKMSVSDFFVEFVQF